jgi:hypothetical protein
MLKISLRQPRISLTPETLSFRTLEPNRFKVPLKDSIRSARSVNSSWTERRLL